MAVAVDVGPGVLLVLRIKDEVVELVPCALSVISWLSLHIVCIFALSVISILLKYLSQFGS